MPVQDIPVGLAPNDDNGIPLRDAFIIINENFDFVVNNKADETTPDTDDAKFSTPEDVVRRITYLTQTQTYTPAAFGAEPGGVTDNLAPLDNAIAAVQASGAGKLLIPRGEYFISEGMASRLLTADIDIEFAPGARIVAGPALTAPIFDFTGASGTGMGDYRVTFERPDIDLSAADYTGNQPSGIQVKNLAQAYIYEPKGYGGATWTGATVGGDSFVEPINVGKFLMRGGLIEGFIDNGVYATGGNDDTDVDDGGTFEVYETTFKHCNNGIVGKRASGIVKAANCHFIDCNIGVVSADVAASQEVDTAKWMEITGNTFEFITARAIEFRGQTKGLATDNFIRNWGRTERVATTPTTIGTYAPAILMNGASRVIVSDNRLQNDYTANLQIGIAVKNYTDGDSVLWTGGAISGGNNSMFGVPVPFRDMEADVTPSVLTDNYITTSPTFDSLVTGSVFEGRQGGNTAHFLWTRAGTAGAIGSASRYAKGPSLFGSASYDPASLTTGTGVTTTVTVTGAALGDFVQVSFTIALSDVVLSAWVSSADTVSVRFQNVSGGTRDLSAGTIYARVTKL